MTNYYETCFIARQDLSASRVEELAQEAQKLIESYKGKIHKVEDWGQRVLAYRINKNRKGHYILLEFEAAPEAVLELNRILSLNEEILRHMSVRLDKLSDGPSVQLEKTSSREAA